MVREFCSRLIQAWMKLGHFIGDLIARIALLLVFWLAVVPIHFMWTVLGKDPMNRKWNKNLNSYFDEPEPIDPNHWRRMF